MVQHKVYEEVWVLIDEPSGRVTKRFDPRLLPDSVALRPGPFVPVSRGPGARKARSSSAIQRASGSGQYEGWIGYYHVFDSAYVDLPGLPVSLTTYERDIYDPDAEHRVASDQAESNEQGYFYFDCPSLLRNEYGGQRLEISSQLENGFVEVQTYYDYASQGQTDVYWVGSYTSCSQFPYTLELIFPSDPAHLFQNSHLTVQATQTHFQVYPPKAFVTSPVLATPD